MYVDYQYYVTDYLLGRKPEIAETDFPFFERLAEKEVDNRTYGRIATDQTLLTEGVKNCICAVTEFLWEADSLDKDNFANGGGQLVSYSNDGDSGSYDMSQSVYASQEARQTKINSLVSFYLSGTGLLYKGVD